MTVGEKVRQIREEHGEVRKETQLELGISLTTLTNIENETVMPSIRLLARICRHYKITLANFFEGVEVK